ncbi:MAG: hypothetical protein JOY62_15035 [Acidobacteriaceae bacterium]|nr:hypothetical protein [Acidobacteriaceae bacterium]
MSTEQILKLQPDRTLYLRGFDGFGAAASLCQASPTGFTVYGVFRDMADFCVLVLYDADNTFEHYTVRYLPNFDFSGMVLSFNLTYQGLQPIDSAKYSWVDWAQLDIAPVTGANQQVRLWDYATLVSGNYSVAQGTFTFTAPGGCYLYDRLTLFVNNAEFDFVAVGNYVGMTAAQVAQWFADSINSYSWWTYEQSSVSVIASTDGSGALTLKNARTGHVNVSGTDVEWSDGTKFPGIAAGSTIYIGGNAYIVAAVNSPTSLTLTSDAGSQAAAVYLAEYGGLDGNSVTVYIVVRPGNINLQVDNPVLPLTGGNSDNVTWNVSLDFSALGIDQIRQAWITFAPQLPASSAYSDTEWTATFSNWSVADPNNTRTLQIAGPGSLRIGNDESGSCTYSGAGWSVKAANNYWHGFARVTAEPGDSITVSYTSRHTHDLYLGTSLYVDRGIVSVTLDGNQLADLDCFLNLGSELVTRRLIQPQVPAGAHTVTFTVKSVNHVAQFPTDINSSGFTFIFDYIEAAVPTAEVADATVTYGNISPALDFDTDATYKVSPQRLLWHLLKLGFNGQLNEYLGVFWWNQRKRFGETWNSGVVTFNGEWQGNEDPRAAVQLTIGGFTMTKSMIYWDTADTIAQHFLFYINSASIEMWAEKTGTGQLTIYPKTPSWGEETFSAQALFTTTTGTITTSGSIAKGVQGNWQVDPSASNPINFPIRPWHSDLFNAVNAAGLLITTSFSMELVYPPDDGTLANAWQARYYDGTTVQTDTGYAHLVSSQCSFIDNMTQFQQSVFTTMAGLQSAAGLTPWLQFGEFLWWFFSETSLAVGDLAATDPVTIETAGATGPQPHGMTTGDRVVITGVGGCTSVNGTWAITVVDDTHFTVPVSPNGDWVTGSGQVRGGSMAYYDPVTAAAAQSALGRPLYKFTCQDDDPTVNGGADASFLAGRLKAHIDAIRTAVLAQYPNAKFEILYPNDVNNPVCLLGPGVQYPQGGRLNAAVNLPVEFQSQATSGLDRFKVEALSWGATYLQMDLAHQAIVFALTSPMSWAPSSVAYLIPWFTGTCPWPRELLLASTRGLQLINFWAYDHLAMMSWPLPLPSWLHRSSFGG